MKGSTRQAPPAPESEGGETLGRSEKGIQRIIDFVAGTAMIVAAAFVIFRVTVVSTRSPVPGPKVLRPSLPLPEEPVSLQGLAIEGNPKARVGIIEYSDFQCPFCGRFARESLPELRQQYVQPGKILIAFGHYPLQSIHTDAMAAAIAAKCAQDHGRFWPFHDRLFSDSKPVLSEPSLLLAASAVGISGSTMAECRSGDVSQRVGAEVAEAEKLQVRSTPTFSFGTVTGDGKLKVTNRMSGAMPKSAFTTVIDALQKQVLAER